MDKILTLIEASGLFSDGYAPFLGAGLIVFMFFGIELIGMLLGMSVLSMGDGADFDLDLDLEVDPLDLDGLSAEGIADLEISEATSLDAMAPSSWMGFGRVPFLVWLNTALGTFAMSGIGIQTLWQIMFGDGNILPAYVAVPPAAVLMYLATARASNAIAKLLPSVESYAVTTMSLARRRGVVVEGTARLGLAAEVKVYDQHGNPHYLRLEPFRDDDVIPKGTEVLVLKLARQKQLKIIPIS